MEQKWVSFVEKVDLGCFSWTSDHVMTFPNLCDNVLLFKFLFDLIFFYF